MNISSLKIVKAQKRAINWVIILPLTIMVVVMAYLIISNYRLENQLAWGWLSIYLLPLVFMFAFDGVLLFSTKKKSNLNQVLSQFSEGELIQIDAQSGKKVSIFKTPLIYTDKVVFAAKGLSVQAILPQDLVWLKHQTATGAIEVVTRQKNSVNVHSQFSEMFFKQFVEKVRAQRPHVLVSSNQTSGEGKEYTELFKNNFAELVKKSDGV